MVEIRAVVNAGADDRQAQRHIDSLHRFPLLFFTIIYEADGLEGDMALIVVHAHHDIVPAAQCLAEHAVRGQGTDGVDPFGPGCFDRRSDLGDLLGAEQSVLSAMGIQAGNRHPRLFNADILAGLVRNLDHIQHTVFFDTITRFPQGNMGGNVNDPQIICTSIMVYFFVCV